MQDEEIKQLELRAHRKKVRRDPKTIVPVGARVNPPEKTAPQKSAELDAERKKNFRPEKTFMKWRAPEFIYYEKSRTWYLTVVIIFAALIAFAIFYKSFLMGIAFFVAGAIFYLYAQKKPTMIDIAITDKGIKHHDRFFPYENLRSFWITYEPPQVKLLNIGTKHLMIPKLSIILTNQDPVAMRKVLIEELPEDEKLDEGAVDHFSRRIKF